MNYIKKNILESNLYYENTLILKYHIEYPSICLNTYEEGIIMFNCYNKTLAYKLKEKTENELYKEAIESYKFNKENDYPIMVYEIYANFEITYDSYDIISLYRDEYIFLGGAHGNTIRTSQTWNLSQGKMLSLEKFFLNDPYFTINIFKEINKQIALEPDIYFENSCSLVIDTFNPKNFYLTQNGLTIYFQQYDIAPYSSGIRTFLIT